MSRRACLLAGLVLLAGATALRPHRPSAAATPLAALGDSMGGARVMAVDALFLRAEALRKTGRTEDAAALYATVLQLDPENEPAVVFLANTYVDELLPLGLAPVERFAWWTKARDLLTTALQRRPRSAVLQDRLASLFLEILRSHEDLQPLLEAAFGDPRRTALRHLRVAVEEAEVLPRQGRAHLVRAALLAQDVAVAALASGDADAYGEALGTLETLLGRRAEVLAQLPLEVEGGPDLLSLAQAAVGAFRAVQALRQEEGVSRALAVARVAAYEALLPDSPLPQRLHEILKRER